MIGFLNKKIYCAGELDRKKAKERRQLNRKNMESQKIPEPPENLRPSLTMAMGPPL